ncbi:eppin-like [Leopardus geoffroyi]|uniref:eppin-like n=1 Tax=Leopardus geoffroyi TaxID=46844 RepID=UPI001E265AEA|nr:eppin-like [Leopardus geoffroyi]
MGPLGFVPVLALFILLGRVQEPELVEGLLGKKCPENKPPCSFKEIDHCGRKKRCSGKMKCCKFNCAKKCVDPDEDVCSLPKEVGLCQALIPRWWYNKETKRCSKFTYGGCAGNNNNFQSEAVCRSICPDM